MEHILLPPVFHIGRTQHQKSVKIHTFDCVVILCTVFFFQKVKSSAFITMCVERYQEECHSDTSHQNPTIICYELFGLYCET